MGRLLLPALLYLSLDLFSIYEVVNVSDVGYTILIPIVSLHYSNKSGWCHKLLILHRVASRISTALGIDVDSVCIWLAVAFGCGIYIIMILILSFALCGGY